MNNFLLHQIVKCRVRCGRNQ